MWMPRAFLETRQNFVLSYAGLGSQTEVKAIIDELDGGGETSKISALIVIETRRNIGANLEISTDWTTSLLADTQ